MDYSRIFLPYIFVGGPPGTLNFFELRVFSDSGDVRNIISMQPHELPAYIAKYQKCLVYEVCHSVGLDVQSHVIPTSFAPRQEVEHSFNPTGYKKVYDIKIESRYWKNPEVRIRSF